MRVCVFPCFCRGPRTVAIVSLFKHKHVNATERTASRDSVASRPTSNSCRTRDPKKSMSVRNASWPSGELITSSVAFGMESARRLISVWWIRTSCSTATSMVCAIHGIPRHHHTPCTKVGKTGQCQPWLGCVLPRFRTSHETGGPSPSIPQRGTCTGSNCRCIKHGRMQHNYGRNRSPKSTTEKSLGIVAGHELVALVLQVAFDLESGGVEPLDASVYHRR
jgi:hypothetical protein